MIIFRLNYILLKENEEGEASAVVLFATFGQDPVCLWKLILSEFYGKFGELNKGKTEMFNDNFCAQIGFRSLGDALEAFKESPWKNNFTNPCFYKREWIPHVAFHLLYHAPEHVNLFPTTNCCCFSPTELSTVVLWPLSKKKMGFAILFPTVWHGMQKTYA